MFRWRRSSCDLCLRLPIIRSFVSLPSPSFCNLAPSWATVRVNGMHADDEVSLLTAAALSSLMQSDQGDGCPPLVLEAVMGHGSSGHAFIPGAVLFSLSEIDVCLEDDTGSPLPIAGNYCLRGPTELQRALERHGVQAGRRVVVYTQCRRHTAVRGQALGERGHHHRYRPATAREGVADVIVAARLVWCPPPPI